MKNNTQLAKWKYIYTKTVKFEYNLISDFTKDLKSNHCNSNEIYLESIKEKGVNYYLDLYKRVG